MNLLELNLSNLGESTVIEKAIFEAVAQLQVIGVFKGLTAENERYQLLMENRFDGNEFGETLRLNLSKENFAEVEDRIENEFELDVCPLKYDDQNNWIKDENQLKDENGSLVWSGGMLCIIDGQNITTKTVSANDLLKDLTIKIGQKEQTITSDNPIIGLETYTTKISNRQIENGYLPNAVLHRKKGIQIIVEVDNATQKPIGKKRIFKRSMVSTLELKTQLEQTKGILPTSISNLCIRLNESLTTSKFFYQSGVCESFAQYVDYLSSLNYSDDVITNDSTLGWYLSDANEETATIDNNLSKEVDFSNLTSRQVKIEDVIAEYKKGNTVKFGTISTNKQTAINTELEKLGLPKAF